MKSFITWDIMSCSLLKVNWHVPLKYQLTFDVLHGIISQKTELFNSIEFLKMLSSKLITIKMWCGELHYVCIISIMTPSSAVDITLLNNIQKKWNHSKAAAEPGNIKLLLYMWLAPGRRVFEKLMATQLVKKINTLFGMKMFTVTFTRAHHWILIRTRWILFKHQILFPYSSF
jgi:hypothetical protein